MPTPDPMRRGWANPNLHSEFSTTTNQKEHDMPEASMKDVQEFFGRKPGQTLSEFVKEWQQLSEEERRQIREGIGNGTFTY